MTRRENDMKRSIRKAALLCGAAMLTSPALAADVTPDRLANPDKEPQNWLMNQRPHFYVAKRFEQMVKVLKRRKKASFEKVKV